MKKVKKQRQKNNKIKLDAVLERLQSQKEESKKHENAFGFEDGLNEAENLGYEAIREVITLGEIIRKNDILTLAHQLLLKHKDLEYLLTAGTRSDQYLEFQFFDRESYCEGWIKGVEEFWGQVKDRV